MNGVYSQTYYTTIIKMMFFWSHNNFIKHENAEATMSDVSLRVEKKNGVQTSNWKKTRPSVSFPVTCFDSFDSDTNPENEQKKITEKNAH